MPRLVEKSAFLDSEFRRNTGRNQEIGIAIGAKAKQQSDLLISRKFKIDSVASPSVIVVFKDMNNINLRSNRERAADRGCPGPC